MSAANNHLVALDNQSFIPDWLSDALCRMATGGTNAKRRHYTNGEEVLVSYCNPGLLNGIVDLLRRDDLRDRCLIIELPVLESRISISEFWDAFESIAGKVLGGLLDALVYALAHPAKDIADLPRMAEFATFVSAAEPELARQWNLYASESESACEQWNVGDFLPAYKRSIEMARTQAIEQVPWIRHLEALLNRHGGKIEMPATQLLVALQQLATAADEPTYKNAGWPVSATGLGGALLRLAPVLKEYGIIATRKRQNGGTRQRLWVITYDDGGPTDEPGMMTPTDNPAPSGAPEGSIPEPDADESGQQDPVDEVFKRVQEVLAPWNEDELSGPGSYMQNELYRRQGGVVPVLLAS